ncbi:phage tail tip fiber protein [Pseudomonas syringae]|uniref:phage tail tip fiber protein n=1 Tax=Pseudomonas syringae TaxID=317 RepID=UPI0023F71D77|nr:DUF1983 domain-containing protein [Pseudomonas syringae]MDF7792935.1 DUF1983 domain-containing protein [Pseudomonas syringae]
MPSGVKKIAQVAVGAVIGFVQGGPVGAAIGAGLAFYAASQQEKLNTKSPLRDNEPSAQTVRSSKAPVRFILGRVSTGGVLVWAQEQSGTATEGEQLHLVYVLCEGAIDGLENIYLGEEEIGSFGEFASYELIVNPTEVNAFLKANCADWKDSQIGRGLSFVRITLKYSAEKFPSGIPDTRFVVRGRNDIYDPRTGNNGYTENTALHILWFLRNRCNVPDDEIVFETFASAANVSDEAVTNADGSVSQRYRTSCVIGADEQRPGVLQKLEASCAGKLIRVGGRWMLQAGAYYGPYDFEITEDMIIGTVSGSTESTNDSAINTVRGTFIDPEQSWTETDYPEVSVSEWILEDGGEAAETMTFSYVTDAYQPQRLANIAMRQRRAGGAISLPMNFWGYNCRPGRVVRVNLPSLNILGEFIVSDWSMGDSEGCTVQVKQYEAAIFDDAVGQAYNPLGFINLPSGGLGSPTGLKWTPDDTAEVVQGVLSWVPPSGIVTSYAVVVRQAGKAIQAQTLPASASQCNLSGLVSGTYTMSVAAIGPMARSGEATLSVNVGGPPMPESCVVQSSLDSITLIPKNVIQSLNGGTYEYFFTTNPQAPVADATYIGQGLSFTHTGLGFYKNYYYYVRSTNAYGKSPFLYVPAATSNDVTAYLEALTGQLTASQFGKDLLSKLEKIDGNGPDSVNARLAIVRTALNEQIADVDGALADVKAELQQQIDSIADLADSMPYKPGETYAAGQGVLGSDGIIYQATQSVPVNTPPPNTTYWLNVGQAVATAVGLASRVQTVETKVTSIEGVNTAQAQQLTGLQTSLDGKASASSVQSIGNRVTDAEGKLTSQGSAITGLTNALPGKANVSTVDALTNTVNQQGGVITSQGQSLTNIAASIAMVGGQNLVYNPSFEKRGATILTIADGWEIGGPATGTGTSLVQSGIDPKGLAQRVDFTGLTASTYMDVVPAPAKRPSAAPGQPFTFFVNFRATTGLIVRIFLQPLNSSSAVLQTVNSVSMVATGSWQLHSLTIASLPADTTTVHMITRVSSVNSQTSGFLEVDRAQAQITTKVEGWRDNADTLKAEVAGQAEATSALTARVTQNETGITSASNQLVSLSNSVGTSGGQNLFFNPAFIKESAVAGAAEGWQMDAGTGGAGTASLVTSWLVSSEKAQRLDVTGLNLSANYRGIRISPANYRPKVTAGNSVVASCYVRATAGLVFKIFIQGVNAAGTDAVTVSGPLIVATGGTQRIVYDYPNLPAGTASVQVYFRLYGSDTVGAGFVEYTRAQLEVGTTVTGWRDNNGLLGAEQAATSSAVAGLNSSVTQQGSAITAVSGQVTALKASLAGEGSNFAASPASWEFLSNLNGFTASVQAGSPTLVANPTFARMTGAGQFFKNSGIDANGTTYPYLRMRFKRANSTRTAGLLYWANQDGGLSEARVIGFKVDITTSDWQTVEIDLSGNTGWVGKTNTAIRLDIVNSGDTSATVDMAYISIGNKMPGASAAALSSTTATVTQQGLAITAQTSRVDGLSSAVGSANAAIQSEANTRANAVSAVSSRVDGLNSTVGNVNAALQSESSTRANETGALSRRVDDAQATAGNANAYAQQAINTAASVDGKVSSSIVNKVQVTANGIRYNAGYAVGIDYSGGTVQSYYAVSASSFLILNDNPGNGAVFSPFGVVNGQVFMNEAFIKNGSIDNAKIGDVLYSSNYVAQRSGWILRKDGIFEINSTIPGAGRIMLNGNGLYVYDENGVLRVQVGNLG